MRSRIPSVLLCSSASSCRSPAVHLSSWQTLTMHLIAPLENSVSLINGIRVSAEMPDVFIQVPALVLIHKSEHDNKLSVHISPHPWVSVQYTFQEYQKSEGKAIRHQLNPSEASILPTVSSKFDGVNLNNPHPTTCKQKPALANERTVEESQGLSNVDLEAWLLPEEQL